MSVPSVPGNLTSANVVSEYVLESDGAIDHHPLWCCCPKGCEPTRVSDILQTTGKIVVSAAPSEYFLTPSNKSPKLPSPPPVLSKEMIPLYES